MLMAMYLKDLTVLESNYLTQAMRASGEILSWPDEWNGLLVDKHSTGGVGDKISLVLAPALAACGLKVPMISGRGLAHTGGTLDKLEAIPGFRVSMETKEMLNILRDVGCCIVGQTANLCPADKILYKSRDITATVDNLGLIAASIVSKKAAENINALVLDVKTGKGAFCEDMKKATDLAELMVKAGNDMGIKTSALITDMNSPIGYMVGNALEVAEAVDCLRGGGPSDVTELVENLGAKLLVSMGREATDDAGRARIRQTLQDGTALDKFRLMTIRQGVDEAVSKSLCDDHSKVLPKAKMQTEIKSMKTGTVCSIDPMVCAEFAQSMGAGRYKSDDVLKLEVGLQLLVKVNTQIKEGEAWVIVHHNDELLEERISFLNSAIHVGTSTFNTRILKVIE
ncbi:hypothetical protein SNE40_005003 [Patella caerulea]